MVLTQKTLQGCTGSAVRGFDKYPIYITIRASIGKRIKQKSDQDTGLTQYPKPRWRNW